METSGMLHKENKPEPTIEDHQKAIGKIQAQLEQLIEETKGRLTREILIEKCIDEAYEAIAEKAVKQLEAYVNDIQQLEIGFSLDCHNFFEEQEDPDELLDKVVQWACKRIVRRAHQKLIYDLD